MANSNKEPLLQFTSPRKKPPLSMFTLPEEDEVSIPMPLTPSEYKDRLIFGPTPPPCSPRDPSPLLDALPSQNASSSSSSFSDLPALHAAGQPEAKPQSPQDLPRSSSAKWTKGHPLHRSRTAPAMAVINDLSHPAPIPKPKFGKQSVVRQAFVLLVLYLLLGVLIYWFNRDKFVVSETHPVVDAFYFCIVTMCTIGYGDITPNSVSTKVFSILFVLVGFGFIDILLSGMVTYVLDLQESYLSKALKPGADEDSARSIIFDVKKGRMRIRLKVALALGVVVICIGIGVGFMHFIEGLGWLDSFYLSVMSVTTVGYGDRAFTTMPGRIFAAVWLLVSTLAVARAFLYLAEARVDKRNRRMVKWVLGQNLTVSQFLAADIDHNGFVSKSEFVVYKLKEMGKVSEKDVMQISNQFDRLDLGNLGRITLADLMECQTDT